jgi:hypothetical protein
MKKIILLVCALLSGCAVYPAGGYIGVRHGGVPSYWYDYPNYGYPGYNSTVIIPGWGYRGYGGHRNWGGHGGWHGGHRNWGGHRRGRD